MAYERLIYENKDGVAIIRLNDPPTLNALSNEMGEELRESLQRAAESTRAIVLTSEGRAFSSGFSLGSGGFDMDDPNRDAGIPLETVFNALIREMRELPVPFITAVRGAAAGVGCSIALMGDIVIAGESTYFLQAFRRIGLVPDGGSPWLLSRTVGRVRAMEMMLLGDKIPAAKALEWGMITRLVPDADIDRVALDIARELAAGPTLALGMIRKSAWAALESPLDVQLELERALQREAGRKNDFVEGVAAFREKRPAKFTGT